MDRSIVEFIEGLRRSLPSTLDQEERLCLLFNMALVKAGERPSVLIDYHVTVEKLENHSAFNQFVESDSDLRIGRFKTESTSRFELFVYHRSVVHLFTETDISDRSREEIHKTRGERLGYPHVITSTADRNLVSLNMQIVIPCDGGLLCYPCYSYLTPKTLEAFNDGLRLWLRFQPYAKILGYGLSFSLSPWTD